MSTAIAPLTEEEFLLAHEVGGELAEIAEALIDPYYSFVARPDRPELNDCQSGFEQCTAKVSVGLGGNRSGKTRTAAQKVARIIRETPPPRLRCPFWVIGETYDLSCGVCWDEKLSHLIPREMIHSIDWYKSKRNWPYAVQLRHPTIPGEVGWVLEFKSFEQGRAKMQAASIGGAWFNEQPPLELVDEVFARTVDYRAPIIIDFTPLKPTIDWPERYRRPPDGWKFFQLNTECNDTLAPEEVKRFLDSIPEDYRETRRIGEFASFKGMVFKDFRPNHHVIDPFPIPETARRLRGIDFGWVAPFACIRVARLPYSIPLSDGRIAREGTWVVYHEYYKRETLLHEHADAIIGVEEWDHRNQPSYFGPTVADHDAQDIAELRSHGVPTVPAEKGENSIEMGLYAMKKLMMGQSNLNAPKFLVFNTCKKLIAEMQAYRYDEATDNRDSREQPIKKDDHGIDALRYALVEGLHRAGEFPTEALDLRKQPAWREASKDFVGA